MVRALDAAHLTDKSCRVHNVTTDGILLRKDLHALYDAKLLEFADGAAEIAENARGHCSLIHGHKFNASWDR